MHGEIKFSFFFVAGEPKRLGIQVKNAAYWVSGPFDVATMRSPPAAERWCFFAVCVVTAGNGPLKLQRFLSYVYIFSVISYLNNTPKLCSYIQGYSKWSSGF